MPAYGSKLTDEQYRSLQNIARSLPPPANQRSNLIGGREGQARIGSGVLGTLFDVIDQPRSAVAGAIYNAVDDDEKTNMLAGFVNGLKGDSHTSGAQILEQLGVKNNVLKGVGGFIADVGLDPMTYVGAKKVKGIGRELAEREALQMAATTGATHNADTIGRMTQQIMDAHPSKIEFSVGLPGRKKPIAAIEKGSGELRLTSRGNRVAGTTAGANALDTVMAKTVGLPGENKKVIARGFSRAAEEPYGLADINMTTEAQATALHDMHYKVRKELYAPFTEKEQEIMWRAYQDGTDLSDVPLANQNHKMAQKYGLKTLEDGIRLARSEREKVFEMQKAAGIVPADAVFNPNSLNKVILHPERYSTMPHVNVPDTGSPGGAAHDALKNRTPQELDEIEAALAAYGKQPIGVVKDLAASMHAEMETSYRQMGRAKATKMALDTTGLHAEPGSDLEKYFQEGKGPLAWVKVQKKNNPFGGVDNPLAQTEAYANHWVPRDVARVMNFSEKVLTDHSTGAEIAGLWSKLQGHWKGLVVASPGYFARTSMGDIIMNAADGVRTYKPYQRSFQILQDVKANEAQDIYSSMLDTATPLDVVPTRSKGGATHTLGSGKNAVRLNSQQINERFIEEGGASGIIQTERVGNAQSDALRNTALEHARRVGTTTSGGLLSAEAKLADWNNVREKYFRMAHFVDAWDKNLKKGMTDEAASKAAMDSVRKINIDYRNLSSFERNSVRKVIPFYSWFRRNSQLQAEMLFTKPGFMSLYPKTVTAVQNMLGTDEGNGDWMLPQWIRESYPVRVVAGDSKNKWLNQVMRFAAGAGPASAVMAPLATGMTPLQDLSTVTEPFQKAWDEKSPWGGFKQAAQNLGTMTSPPIRGLYELGTGRSLYSGAPIKNWNSWLMGQVGAPGRAGQMISEGANASTITSFLTGMQLKPINQEGQASEFKRRTDILDKQTRTHKQQIARQYGYDYDTLPDKYKTRMTDYETEMLKQYLKWSAASVGTTR
jgi:hypothetical protein